jgi:hypothetical protein
VRTLPTSRCKCGWRHAHWHFMAKRKVSPAAVAIEMTHVPKRRGLSTPRARHVFAFIKVLNKIRKKKGMPTFQVVNTSQSIDRCSPKAVGLPTLTPGGQFVMVDTARVLTPAECLLLMGFPLKTVDLGANSDREVAHLAGNAMHVKAIAAALAIALTLVNKQKFKRETKHATKKSKLR